jgi:hydrogenase expression/formation protein HypC
MCLAIPGKLVEIAEDPLPELRKGKVDFGGIRKEISLAFTPQAVLGDYVLVHVGFAITVIDEAEAQRVFTTLQELEELSLEVPG